MDQLMRFPNAVNSDPMIEVWFAEHNNELGALARSWFEIVRSSGNDVQELMHDGHPTACVDDAAFAYVNVFKAHVNLGFFRGADLVDPHGLLEGSGKNMRHVKLRPGEQRDNSQLRALIEAAYLDMQGRVY